jgi:ABC-2 type transport system ATP-binding protein
MLPIEVQGLKKSYGATEAVKGIDFSVGEGEIFGLLGPNGAGKTTTLEILEGLRPRSAGQVSVLGFDPSRDTNGLKDKIGVCLQATNLPDKIRVHEAVELFGQLYSKAVDKEPLLSRLQLSEKRDAFFQHLSGGQKQRLGLALALVNDPKLIFLDEPTAALDPQVRQEIHSIIQALKREGRTVLLTTHYIEEAEKLCDRIAIVDGGRVIAMGTVTEIKSRARGKSAIEVRTERPLTGAPPTFAGAEQTVVAEDGRGLTVSATSPSKVLVELVRWIDQAGVGIEDLQMKRPSLEDVFIELTGRSLRE